MIVNEESTGYITLDFIDRDGAPAVPQTVRYWIHNYHTGTEVRGETSVTPLSTVTITLTPSDNAIGGQRDSERLVTVIAAYGADDQVIEEIRYIVRNLQHVPAG